MSRFKTFDWWLCGAVLLLLFLSVATIYTITYGSVGNKLALSQAVFGIIGIGLMIAFTILDYRMFKGMSVLLIIAGMFTLIPLFPLWSHKLPFVICEFNSCRWIDLIFFQFQSAEFFKIVAIIGLSAFLSSRVGKMEWWKLLLLLGVIAIPVFMVMQQPDLGTSLVIFFTSCFLLLLGRFPVWIWIALVILGLVSLPLVWQQLKPYQKERVEVFLNPEKDPLKTGYNVRQAEIAVGNGGVWGRGFGQGSQSQLNFLPVAHTDFIFAGYAEATGYVGSLALLALFGVLIWRALVIAEQAKDPFGRLLACGIAAMFTLQVFINAGMNIRLMPVTGVTLPFVSYGGTSLFVNMIAIGLLESIMVRHKKISFT